MKPTAGSASAPSHSQEIRTAKEVASPSPALSRFQTYRVLMLFRQSTRNRPNLSVPRSQQYPPGAVHRFGRERRVTGVL
jgi:hypothetical protein